MAYASGHGHALIDRELYLPQSWAQDRDRCRAAGIPEEAGFTTKPRQVQVMIGRAIAAGVPFAWFTADETYGQAKWLQAWLEEQDVCYVMAIRCSDTLTTSTGEQRADALIAGVPARAWQRLSTGIFLTITVQQYSELALQLAVPGSLAAMPAQEITKVDVITMRLAPRHHHVQTVIDGIGGRPERFPARDTQISLMLPSASG